MKTVIMIGPVAPPTGGIASVLQDIVNSELTREYHFEVFRGDFIYPLWAKGRITRNLFRMKRFLELFFKIVGTRPALTHIHSSGEGFLKNALYSVVARIAGSKVLFHFHGTDWDRFYARVTPRRQFAIRMLLKVPHIVVVLYSLWAQNIHKIGVNTAIKLLPNYIHDLALRDLHSVEDARVELGLGDGSFVVLMVGSVGRRKGVFDILKAAPVVAEEADSVRFILVGGEEERGEMHQLLELVKRDSLQKWVKILGDVERDRVTVLLQIADAFLLPSYDEGVPIAIIEALRSGVPVISTRVGGIPEMIGDGVSGLLINPGDPGEIARAVLRIKNDSALKEKLSRNGRRRFEDAFEFSRGIDEIRSIYKSLNPDSQAPN